MEIRDPIHGSMHFSEAEVKILDAPEFQRLRAIKQLGFSEFSFPGATHNRYIHSLGVCHLAGSTFDSIFRIYPFSKPTAKIRFRQALRLAALLHDIGHGPLSHTTEQVMPRVESLEITAYLNGFHQNSEPPSMDGRLASPPLYVGRRANHEDYTLKFVLDSPIAAVLKKQFPEIAPIHIACLIDRSLYCPDDFFVDRNTDFRPILSQLVSSELDVDRMDYLERDSYFCGTSYGKIDLSWIIQNLTFHRHQDKLYLALNRRALYSFDDFLLSRHHMHLMVYCHHKSIIYEELLNRYLLSPDCDFKLPADIAEYTRYNDYKLHEHLAQSDNIWAKRIAQREPYRVLIELHNTSESKRIETTKKILEKQGIDLIATSSLNRLSKYHSMDADESGVSIYVVDQYDKNDIPSPITKSTEIFKRYEGARLIDRIYVAPEKYTQAEGLV